MLVTPIQLSNFIVFLLVDANPENLYVDSLAKGDALLMEDAYMYILYPLLQLNDCHYNAIGFLEQ